MIDGHGDDLYKFGTDVLKANFSSNIYGPTDNEAIKQHLSNKISVIDSYPEPEPYTLQEKLEERLNVSKGNVVAFSGATDAIYTLAKILGPHSVNVIVQPTFNEYNDALSSVGAKIYNVDSFKKAANLVSCFRMDAFWFCNPNNPTGCVVPLDEICQLAKRCTNTLFIIDQSYAAFTDKEVFNDSDINLFPNVVIIHSLTKEYKLPGLRLGYIVTKSPLILDQYSKYRFPWSINALAIEAGLYVTGDEVFGKKNFDLPTLLEEAKKVRNKLIGMGIEVSETDTHFMLCKLPEDKGITSSDLKQHLIDKYGLLIRDASNFKTLGDKHFRIAVQDASSNSLLLSAIKAFIK